MKNTILTITVDTEFSTHKDDMGILGRIEGKEYGLPKIYELLEQYGLKATFFVDVYTNKKEYISSLKEIGLQLKRRGHDLQLHTHPNGIFDPDRGAMKNYSLKEQLNIIKMGKEIFSEWFGYLPIAHRAGDWGANYNTLEALQANDIYIDSSMFYGWANCQLNTPPLSKNRLVEYNKLLEIPASVYECETLGVFKPFRLLSTDANSLEETWAVIKKLQEHDIPVINCVYHSFSFLNWNEKRTVYSVSKSRLRKFDVFLKNLSEAKNIEVKTIKEIYSIYNQNKRNLIAKKDFVPTTGVGSGLLRLMDRLKR